MNAAISLGGFPTIARSVTQVKSELVEKSFGDRMDNNKNIRAVFSVLHHLTHCSTEGLSEIAIYPTGTSSALEIGNGLCSSFQYIQTGRTLSYVHKLLVSSC